MGSTFATGVCVRSRGFGEQNCVLPSPPVSFPEKEEESVALTDQSPSTAAAAAPAIGETGTGSTSCAATVHVRLHSPQWMQATATTSNTTMPGTYADQELVTHNTEPPPSTAAAEGAMQSRPTVGEASLIRRKTRDDRPSHGVNTSSLVSVNETMYVGGWAWAEKVSLSVSSSLTPFIFNFYFLYSILWT